MELTPTTRRVLSRTVTVLAFLIGIFLFVRLWRSFGPALQEIDLTGRELLLIGLIPLAAYAIVVARTWVLLKAFGVSPALAPLTILNVAAQAVGQLLPGGVVTELAFRTFSFSRAGVPLHTSVMVNALDGFVRFTANTIALFFVAMYFLLTSFVDEDARLAVILGFVFSLFGLVILLTVLFGGIDKWFLATAKRLAPQVGGKPDMDARLLDTLKHHRSPLIAASLLSLIGFILEPLQLWVIVKAAGFTLPFWAVFWLTQAIGLPRSLPVPGGIGLVEEASVQFSRLIGEAGSVGFTASILWRLRLVPYILLGLLCIPFLGFMKLVRGEKGHS